MEIPIKRISIRPKLFIMTENTFQPSASRSVVRYPEKIGIKVTDKKPLATIWLSISGITNAI